MKLGIVGLPKVGKTTLFNALTSAGATTHKYSSSAAPNIGSAQVPDGRLKELAKIYNTKNLVYASVSFVDIAGLVAGASKGEGLGNKFLSFIREVDAIVHVLKCFKDDLSQSGIDALRDIEVINLELILADLDTLTRRIDKTKTLAKSGDKRYKFELEVLDKIYKALSEERSARSLDFDEIELSFVESLQLLTHKKVIYCCNVSDNNAADDEVEKVKEYAKNDGAEMLKADFAIEAEIAALPENERGTFMEEFGITQSSAGLLINKSYSLLGLMSFLTAGEKEVRAWTIPKGTKAPRAGGKIHSDIERGFIRAETVDYDTLVTLGTYAAAKEKGKVRSEGKEYVVKEGDVILFRFNV
jgi:hypothetical protein